MRKSYQQSHMSLSQQLYRMTWPMLMGMLAISSSQLVDSAFIGQLGTQPLAVLGYSMPIYQLIIGIQVGLGIAATSLISTALGAKNKRYAQELGSLVLSTGLILITLLCLLLWSLQKPIIFTLGAEQNLAPLVSNYWFPWLISCWLGAMLYFGFSIFRAQGETRFPGTVLLLSSLLNILLDPLFIFTLELGLAGAAWATVCAFMTGCIIIYARIFHHRLIRLPTALTTTYTGLRNLLVFTAPAMMSQFIPPLTALFATALVAIAGNEAVAAWGLGNRIEFFAIIIVLSLTMAMPPMIGRLLGRKELLKIDQLVRIAIRFVLLSQLLITIFIICLSVPLSNLLSSDPAVSLLLKRYLWLVPISYGALGLSMILVSVCSAIGMPNLALLMSALRLLLCYLPLLWTGAELGGITGLFIGAMAGNICAGLISWQLYQHYFKRLEAQHNQLPGSYCTAEAGRQTVF